MQPPIPRPTARPTGRTLSVIGSVRTAPASDSVAERIRVMIVTQGLPPGARLGREEDLARQLGVSRATLREGLRVLLAEHLVRATRGRGGGIFVAATPQEAIGLSVSDGIATMIDTGTVTLDQVLETRMLLEVPIAGLAASRAGDADLADLRAIVAEQGQSADPERLAAVDTRLHHRLVRVAADGLTASLSAWIIDVLAPRLALVIRPLVVEVVIAGQHRDIVEAIARRHPPSAERAMREHLTYVRDLVGAAQHYGPVSAASGPASEVGAG